jgi:hypothetical protein
MSPYRTFAGNGRGTNRPNTGIEASKTVGEASILRQVGGAFLPHPTLRRVSGSKISVRTLLDKPLPVGGSSAMLSVLSFFHAEAVARAWPESPSRSPQAALVNSGSFSRNKAERLVRPTILTSSGGRLRAKRRLALLGSTFTGALGPGGKHQIVVAALLGGILAFFNALDHNWQRTKPGVAVVRTMEGPSSR